jgi:hypothetical protein
LASIPPNICNFWKKFTYDHPIDVRDARSEEDYLQLQNRSNVTGEVLLSMTKKFAQIRQSYENNLDKIYWNRK